MQRQPEPTTAQRTSNLRNLSWEKGSSRSPTNIKTIDGCFQCLYLVIQVFSSSGSFFYKRGILLRRFVKLIYCLPNLLYSDGLLTCSQGNTCHSFVNHFNGTNSLTNGSARLTGPRITHFHFGRVL